MASEINSISPRAQWISFFLIGCLSMLYAELFSGASRLWFVDFWSLIVVFPLYMVHVLFFFNLALLTRRTSPLHLYIWGMLFALYESWVTQVLWVGYSAQEPLVRTFLGIGIGEFLALVLFWHPLLSFILPIFVFELLVLSVQSEEPLNQRVLPTHVPFLVKTKFNRRYLLSFYVIGSIFIAANYQGNLFLVVTALGGTYGLIYILYRLARKHQFSVYSLRVTNKGLMLMVTYILLLYVVMVVGLGYFQGRIPGALPVITTFILYGVFGWLVMYSKPAAESVEIPPHIVAHRIALSDYKRLVYLNLILASALCIVYYFIPSLVAGALVFFYVTMCVIGCYIFYRVILLRNKQTQESLEKRYRTMEFT
ncbi:MAG: hypothetical protein HXS44_12795 [Theionarchaea archaeon]|nr:hypothetical protein [Theionarchaea archaeon]